MVAARRIIEVCADWDGLPGPMTMGTLSATSARGHDILSFTYDDAWLGSAAARILDPALRLHAGPQYPRPAQPSFGVFLDSSPDRWGRTLLDRREALRAREDARPPRPLRELDYLLGVHDGHRLGALRFRIDGGPFLDDDDARASPPWTTLRALEAASLALQRDGAEDDPDYGRWLSMLIAPGRSLGGARPKASVVDAEGRLWIAKFPSADDPHDAGAWEGVLHTLAANAGVDVPEARCERFGSRHHTFLSRRFDRAATGRRVHFASAMTLLDHRDGDAGSYLELADVIITQGARATADLEQIWRRVVFNMCVSNTDDHLRNHGFLLEPRGWTLAPAYDLNPVPTGGGLTLNVSETDNAQDLALAHDVAPYFRLKPKRAREIETEVITAVASWREVATAASVPRASQAAMGPAFRLAARA
jgi:serine/threonine-protein kinase HipA